MLTIKKPSFKNVPMEVLKMQWTDGPVSIRTASLKCSACHNVVGEKKIAIAWIRDNGQERGMRLCEDCGKKAEIK